MHHILRDYDIQLKSSASNSLQTNNNEIDKHFSENLKLFDEAINVPFALRSSEEVIKRFKAQIYAHYAILLEMGEENRDQNKLFKGLAGTSRLRIPKEKIGAQFLNEMVHSMNGLRYSNSKDDKLSLSQSNRAHTERTNYTIYDRNGQKSSKSTMSILSPAKMGELVNKIQPPKEFENIHMLIHSTTLPHLV